jgi:predicted ester cyclase
MLQKNKALIRNYIHFVVNTGMVDEIRQYIHEDYTEIHDGTVYKMGIQGAIEHIHGIYNTYPDIHMTVDQQVAEGEWVVISYTMTGTHSGVWMDIPPTGQKIKVTGVDIDRIEQG